MNGVEVIRYFRLLRVAVAMTALLGIGIGVVVVSARTGLAPLDVDMPSYFQPGQTLTVDQPCYSDGDDNFVSDLANCIQSQTGNLKYLVEFKVASRTIQSASKWLEMPVMLGDLVTRWGTPRGWHGSFLVWDDRGAYVHSTSNLSPESSVYFISYGSVPEVSEPWIGFVKDKSQIPTRSLPTISTAFWKRP